MRINLMAFLLVSFLMATNVSAQTDPTVEKIIKISQTDNQTMDHLDILCNRFGGRLVGSDAYENSANWAASKFKEWGMQVELQEVGELAVGFNRGPWFGRMLSDNGMHLHFATPSYTSGTKGVQRGHVLIEPKTQDEFDRMKAKLKGAWVLISGKSDGWPIDYSDKSQKKRDSIKIENEKIGKKNYEIRSENWKNRHSENPPKKLLPLIEEPALFYNEMREAGILGIIQSASTPIRVLYDRKNVHDMTFETLPTIPDIKLDEHQYKVIKRMAEERRYFQLEFDIRNYFKMGPVKYHNVVGVIPGTEFPDEYVMMSGHLDAFDVASGGIDDGSGISASMEAARLLMKAEAKPKRSIIVVLFAAEEFGLYGSKAWVKNNKEKLPKLANMINRDGGPSAPVGISVPDAMREDFEKICASINDINPDFPFEISKRMPREKPAKAWGTDSGPFAVEGVPTIGFKTADPKGNDFRYGEIWHTEKDMFNMSIAENQEHAATVTAVVIYGIANLDHLLSRDGYYLEKSVKLAKKSKKKSKKN